MPTTALPHRAPALSEALSRRFDLAGLRHSSYPIADRFVEAFEAADCRHALVQRAEGATIGGCPPLSRHVHVPCSESICHCCAFSKVATGHHRAPRFSRCAGGMLAPDYLLKSIPRVEGNTRIRELVHCLFEDVAARVPCTGPAALGLAHHAFASGARQSSSWGMYDAATAVRRSS